jgi:CubicO group peptidase (beta-lactamase class C family)
MKTSGTSRIDAALSLARATLPGGVAMATTASETLYEAAFGVRDAAGRVPVTVDTVFGLASMTKAVVSVAALQLVDQGRLSLDGAIAEILPELSAPRVLEGFGPDGAARLRPARSAITLRQLLTHSAGYGHEAINQEMQQFNAWSGLPTKPENSAQLARVPLLFDPGTRWNYGISTDVVGKAMEAVSGQRLDIQMAEGVLAQLGMIDSGFVLTPDLRARLITTQSRGDDGRFSDIGFAMDRGVQWCMGGGGMHGTGRDYLRFIRMILNGGMHEGNRILSAASIEAVLHNQLAPGVVVGKMTSANPAVTNDTEFFPGMMKHWSAAMMINTERAPAGRNAGSLAWAGVVNTYFWIDPAAGIGAVFLAQILPFFDPAVLAAFARFERAIYDTMA